MPRTSRRGRPPIGARVPLALPADLIEQIDELRGRETRSSWIRGVLDAAVRGGESEAVREVLAYAERRGISRDRLAEVLR